MNTLLGGIGLRYEKLLDEENVGEDLDCYTKRGEMTV